MSEADGGVDTLAREVEELEERVDELESNLHIRETESDVVEKDTDHRARVKGVKQVIELVEAFSESGAELQDVYSVTGLLGIEYEVAKGHVEDLRRQGEIYESSPEEVKTT